MLCASLAIPTSTIMLLLPRDNVSIWVRHFLVRDKGKCWDFVNLVTIQSRGALGYYSFLKRISIRVIFKHRRAGTYVFQAIQNHGRYITVVEVDLVLWSMVGLPEVWNVRSISHPWLWDHTSVLQWLYGLHQTFGGNYRIRLKTRTVLAVKLYWSVRMWDYNITSFCGVTD
jgi:hypothetical protein